MLVTSSQIVIAGSLPSTTELFANAASRPTHVQTRGMGQTSGFPSRDDDSISVTCIGGSPAIVKLTPRDAWSNTYVDKTEHTLKVGETVTLSVNSGAPPGLTCQSTSGTSVLAVATGR
jgi:hypothetical protein